jgi:Domain of unknown function (DUF4407)
MIKHISDYFVRLGGGDTTVLDAIPLERAQFVQMACVLLITAGFATISMIFALNTGIQVPLPLSIFLSLLWGIIILNLDRFIVLSINATRDRARQSLIALPGVLLAVLLAFVISVPFVLRIFANDINAQLLAMHHEGFNKADSGILAQLQALSDLSARDSVVEITRLILLVLFFLIETLPIVVKYLLSLGPPTTYEKILSIGENQALGVRKQIEEIKSQTRVNIEVDMRRREEGLGKRANEYVSAELTNVLDIALREWSSQVHARLSSESADLGQSAETPSGPTRIQVNPGFGLPVDDDKL